MLFPQWQIKIPRALTAHLEAFGAGRVDRSGVKFDRLGKTTSGQPIFAVDDATAESIRATFVLDVSLIRSFGRKKGETTRSASPRSSRSSSSRSRCGRSSSSSRRPSASGPAATSGARALKSDEQEVEIEVDIGNAIKAAGFGEQPVTDVFWPREELYREGQAEGSKSCSDEDEGAEETEG